MNIDKFVIVKEIGRGMCGTIYLAKYKQKKYVSLPAITKMYS